MNGILLIDKPAGITSHGVISKLRKKLNTKKIGHAGTLDPTATGLLIICIGQATKISGYLTESSKAYEAEIIFGKTTTTYDLEGQITSEKPTDDLNEEQVRNMLQSFVGDQKQLPPMYSAVKIDGKKLYEYARADKEVEVPTRDIHVASAELLTFHNPNARIRIKCSKGTYIRSIVHDLGQKLDVGATVSVIHRIESGKFDIQDAMPLTDAIEGDVESVVERIIPIEKALQGIFHNVAINQDDEDRMKHGIAYPKSKVIPSSSSDDFNPESLILFVSQHIKNEIAIGRWGTADTIEIKRVF